MRGGGRGEKAFWFVLTNSIGTLQTEQIFSKSASRVIFVLLKILLNEKCVIPTVCSKLNHNVSTELDTCNSLRHVFRTGTFYSIKNLTKLM